MSQADNTAASGQFHITTRISATFAICFVAFYALTIVLPESLFEPLNRLTADMAFHILRLCGFNPVLAGTTLSQDGFAVKVITECSVIYMAILFFSFVVAYPVSLQHKLIGLAAGIPVLHAGNILRIALVFAIGVKKQLLFEFAHVYLGQVLMVLFVIGVCLAWVRTTLTDTRNFKPAVFIARFLAFSSIPCIVWLAYNREYIKLMDHAVFWLFSLFNVRFGFNYQHEIYYQTFNLVTFAGLVLASRVRVVQHKLLVLALGLMVIVGSHILFRICNGLMITFGMQTAYNLSTSISIIGQYLLPTLLWFAIIREETSSTKRSLKKQH
jgi:exosortase H (IPTLxxWG-CTERM-specific)